MNDSSLAKVELTAIIIAFDKPIEYFANTVFSALYNLENVKELHVVIYGADERTGDISLQNIKLKLSQELTAFFPIKITRIWSRVGVGHTIDSILPIINTNAYIIVEEGTIVCDDINNERIKAFVQSDDESVALQHFNKPRTEDDTLNMFNIPTNIVLGKKESGLCWRPFFIHSQITLPADFIEQWKDVVDRTYNRVIYGIGSWIFYSAFTANQIVITELSSIERLPLNHLQFVKLIDKIIKDKKYEIYKKFIPKEEKTYIYDKIIRLVLVRATSDENLFVWLSSWIYIRKFNTKLMVVIPDNVSVSEETTKLINRLSGKIISVPGRGYEEDMQKAIDFCYTKYHDWRVVIGFTDKMIPKVKDILKFYIFEDAFACNDIDNSKLDLSTFVINENLYSKIRHNKHRLSDGVLFNLKTANVLFKGIFNIEANKFDYLVSENDSMFQEDSVDNQDVIFISPFYRSDPAVLISSLMQQSCTGWKLILVHDGPYEEMDKLINQYKNERIIFCNTPKRHNDFGHSCRNFVIKNYLNSTPGKYVVITNDDNYYAPGFIELMTNSFTPNTIASYCDMIHNYSEWECIQTNLTYAHIDCGCFMLLKEKLLDSKVLFDTHFAADWSYINAIMGIYGAENITKVKKVLFVHN